MTWIGWKNSFESLRVIGRGSVGGNRYPPHSHCHLDIHSHWLPGVFSPPSRLDVAGEKTPLPLR